MQMRAAAGGLQTASLRQSLLDSRHLCRKSAAAYLLACAVSSRKDRKRAAADPGTVKTDAWKSGYAGNCATLCDKTKNKV